MNIKTAAQPIKLFKPTSGTEFFGFVGEWCSQCTRDKSLSESIPINECTQAELCPIISKTAAYDIDDKDYPREWHYSEKNLPMCSAFIHKGDVILQRCDRTIDLFEQSQTTHGAQL